MELEIKYATPNTEVAMSIIKNGKIKHSKTEALIIIRELIQEHEQIIIQIKK